MLSEKPILMTTESVEAILEGRKSQTRRTYGLEKINKNPDDWVLLGRYADGYNDKWRFRRHGIDEEVIINCPYGGIGDRPWVRETIAEWQGTIESVKNGDLDEAEALEYIIYKAGAKDWLGILKDKTYGHPWNIRPSIFMPRWASRITRIIALLRAERLLDISEADAKAEGFNSISDFLAYWDILNEKRGYGVDVNPWNWVIGW